MKIYFFSRIFLLYKPKTPFCGHKNDCFILILRKLRMTTGNRLHFTHMKRDLTSILIPFVYFIAGATSLAGVATTFYYKDDLHLSIQQVQFLASIGIIPWSIKPLYGFLSDVQPVFGLRRKPYLFLSGLLGAAGYFSMATWVNGFWSAALAAFISAMGFALADVIVDGIVAERSKTQKEAGKLQSICRGALLAGALVVAYASGVLVEQIGARNVFLITGSLPLITTAFSLLVIEGAPPVTSFSLRNTWRQFRGALTPALLWSALFLFIWRSTPTSGGAFSYYLIDELGFTPEFFGRLAFVSHMTGIIGVVVFRKFLLALPLRTLFFWVAVLSVVLSLPSIGLVYKWYEIIGVSPQFFAMADTLIGGMLVELAFLPLLVLVARVCPKGIEATMFAALASLMNIGLSVSDLGGAWLTTVFHVREATEMMPGDYSNLHIVLWIAILSSLLPLPLLPWLPETRTSDDLPLEPSPSAIAPMITPLQPEKQEIA